MSENHSAQAGPIYIVTVHGTFAARPEDKGDSWWQIDSAFHRKLSARTQRKIVFIPFHWSGSNSESDRRYYANQLQKFLIRKVETLKVNYHIICHSHGGNVILHALNSLSKPTQRLPYLKKIYTIGTPYIQTQYKLNPFSVFPPFQQLLCYSILIVALLYFFATLLSTCRHSIDSICFAETFSTKDEMLTFLRNLNSQEYHVDIVSWSWNNFQFPLNTERLSWVEKIKSFKGEGKSVTISNIPITYYSEGSLQNAFRNDAADQGDRSDVNGSLLLPETLEFVSTKYSFDYHDIISSSYTTSAKILGVLAPNDSTTELFMKFITARKKQIADIKLRYRESARYKNAFHLLDNYVYEPVTIVFDDAKIPISGVEFFFDYQRSVISDLEEFGDKIDLISFLESAFSPLPKFCLASAGMSGSYLSKCNFGRPLTLFPNIKLSYVVTSKVTNEPYFINFHSISPLKDCNICVYMRSSIMQRISMDNARPLYSLTYFVFCIFVFYVAALLARQRVIKVNGKKGDVLLNIVKTYCHPDDEAVIAVKSAFVVQKKPLRLVKKGFFVNKMVMFVFIASLVYIIVENTGLFRPFFIFSPFGTSPDEPMDLSMFGLTVLAVSLSILVPSVYLMAKFLFDPILSWTSNVAANRTIGSNIIGMDVYGESIVSVRSELRTVVLNSNEPTLSFYNELTYRSNRKLSLSVSRLRAELKEMTGDSSKFVSGFSIDPTTYIIHNLYFESQLLIGMLAREISA